MADFIQSCRVAAYAINSCRQLLAALDRRVNLKTTKPQSVPVLCAHVNNTRSSRTSLLKNISSAVS